MKNNWPGRAGLCAALAAAALLAACSTPKHAMRDAQKQLATYQELRELPQANLNLYSQALQRLGYMLNVYKSGDPVLYVQSRTILDSTNLSSPLAGAEIPGDVTEMVRTALNRIGAKVVYVPYHPDYLLAQAQAVPTMLRWNSARAMAARPWGTTPPMWRFIRRWRWI